MTKTAGSLPWMVLNDKMRKFFVLISLIGILNLYAEDGSRLWLPDSYQEQPAVIQTKVKSETVSIAVKELESYWKGASVKLLKIKDKTLACDGFRIEGDYDSQVTIRAASDIGLLYGAYHLLRLQETESLNQSFNIQEQPAYALRLLNHWDNLDGTIERGYAGYSLWKWKELPETLSPRYEQYARANASIGINGTVLNNVNASPDILKTEYLQKVRVIADVFRPYGIKVYLSVNMASPKVLDDLADADPLNPEVIRWWKNKAQEIYRLIPDFGGFLVKANSEGQPGPQDYGRTHADGANLLADVLKPYGGIVMWRAFVYNPDQDDRAKQAYREFVHLDGQFRDNVILQVKNGPVDFQPREPFNPLFGNMSQTPLMPELQITQEYLGFSNHLVFLAPQWKEFFDSDTYCQGEGSTVAQVTNGSIFPHRLTAIAGVANTGEDINWCGHPFAQANWYAFGRLAWDPGLSSDRIADEWLKQTFTKEEAFVAPARSIMLQSWETAVSYMMPLGLHHQFAWGHHYGPEPWCDVPGARPDWLPKYYHQADEEGIGFDRSSSGSNAVAQYFSPLKEQFNSLESCPEKYLLWFHHVPWNYPMKSGRTLWDEMCYHYDAGVQQVREFQKQWDKLEKYVDPERFRLVQSKLRIQAKDAVWWKDACLLYFQTFSKQPIPYDIERPIHELDELMKIKLDMQHHN